MKRRIIILFAALICFSSAWAFERYGRSMWVPAYQRIRGYETVESVIEKYGPSAEKRLIPDFFRANVDYPPERVVLLSMKKERVMELWARNKGDQLFTLIKRYPIKGASGRSGPKLLEGDRQVPEGFYSITHLNPNSSYHLSMKLNYPNPLDLAYAREEGRHQPGSNIFIHGKSDSIGCLAMGDPAIEELFTLVYRTGMDKVEVLIAPYDPRKKPLKVGKGMPEWLPGLYRALTRRFRAF